MKDIEATVAALKRLVKDFRDERDWEQFHDPKNLAEGLTIEAGELLECFLWKDKEVVAEDLRNASFRERVGEELADVAVYVLLMSEQTGIDLTDAIEDKMRKNAVKYPVEKSRGRRVKYTDL